MPWWGGLKSNQERVPRELDSDVALTLKLGGNWPIGKESGWTGEEAGRRARQGQAVLIVRVAETDTA